MIQNQFEGNLKHCVCITFFCTYNCVHEIPVHLGIIIISSGRPFSRRRKLIQVFCSLHVVRAVCQKPLLAFRSVKKYREHKFKLFSFFTVRWKKGFLYSTLLFYFAPHEGFTNKATISLSFFENKSIITMAIMY